MGRSLYRLPQPDAGCGVNQSTISANRGKTGKAAAKAVSALFYCAEKTGIKILPLYKTG